MKNITSNLPVGHISREAKECTLNSVLVDPTFYIRAPLDLLIHAGIFSSTLKGESIPLGEYMPTTLNTVFKYVLVGNTPVDSERSTSTVNFLTVSNADLHYSIRQVENLPDAIPFAS